MTPKAYDFRLGEAVNPIFNKRIGLVCAVANVFWREPDLTYEQFDGAILLMRRSFGYGKTNITLRADAWKLREPELFNNLIDDVASQLFSGTANSHEKTIIGDLFLNNLDTLLKHPPENAVLERKRQLKQMEQYGLVIKNQGKTILDAR